MPNNACWRRELNDYLKANFARVGPTYADALKVAEPQGTMMNSLIYKAVNVTENLDAQFLKMQEQNPELLENDKTDYRESPHANYDSFVFDDPKDYLCQKFSATQDRIADLHIHLKDMIPLMGRSIDYTKCTFCEESKLVTTACAYHRVYSCEEHSHAEQFCQLELDHIVNEADEAERSH